MRDSKCDVWIFLLTNYHVALSDEFTDLPLADDPPHDALPSRSRNKISPQVHNRRWTLIDRTVSKLTTDETDALFSGELMTKAQHGDQPETLRWVKTLDFFVLARMSRFLEIKSALFSVLLDRIAATGD